MWNFKTFIKISDECFVCCCVLCALALFGLCKKNNEYKISSEPRLVSFGFGNIKPKSPI